MGQQILSLGFSENTASGFFGFDAPAPPIWDGSQKLGNFALFSPAMLEIIGSGFSNDDDEGWFNVGPSVTSQCYSTPKVKILRSGYHRNRWDPPEMGWIPEWWIFSSLSPSSDYSALQPLSNLNRRGFLGRNIGMFQNIYIYYTASLFFCRSYSFICRTCSRFWRMIYSKIASLSNKKPSGLKIAFPQLH